MPALDDSIPAILAALTAHYGHPAPATAGLDPFEAFVATILDRVLDLKKRNLALAALRDEGLLEPQALAEADPLEIDDALRSARIPIAKGGLAPLVRVVRWLVELHHGAIEELADPDSAVSTHQLRDELLTLNGVGPATADAVLLQALKRPVYPIDRATYRIFARHGWIDPDLGYDEARDVVERLAPDDPNMLERLSLTFEQVGREFCRATVPKCEKCPLLPFLPQNGPVEPTG